MVAPGNFVDVQDSAVLHVAALILSDVRHQRIFAVCTPWNVSSVAQLLKGLFPNRPGADENEIEDVGVDLTNFREATRAEQLLVRMGKKGWTDIETSVEKLCHSFV